MQPRSRFSGAFGADAVATTAHLLPDEEMAARWPDATRDAASRAAFAYPRWPGVPRPPRVWRHPTSRVVLVADARLWDRTAVRARLAAEGRPLYSVGDGELLLHRYLHHGVKLWPLLSLELYFRAFLDAPRTAPVLPHLERGL